MFDCVIGSRAVVDRAILDKEVVVGPGAIVGEGPDDPPNKAEPTRLNTGITVVGKQSVIPRGARIGRNVRVGGNVRATDFTRKVVPSGGSVDAAPGARPWSRDRGDEGERRRRARLRRARSNRRDSRRRRVLAPRPRPRTRPSCRARRHHGLGCRPRRPSTPRPPDDPDPRSRASASSSGRTSPRRSATASERRTGPSSVGTMSSRSPSSPSPTTADRSCRWRSRFAGSTRTRSGSPWPASSGSRIGCSTRPAVGLDRRSRPGRICRARTAEPGDRGAVRSPASGTVRGVTGDIRRRADRAQAGPGRRGGAHSRSSSLPSDRASVPRPPPGPTVSIVTTSTYDVRPTEHRVAVTVALSITSNLKDTTTRRYFVDRAYLAVIPSATNLRISAASGKPTVSVSSRSDGQPRAAAQVRRPTGSRQDDQPDADVRHRRSRRCPGSRAPDLRIARSGSRPGRSARAAWPARPSGSGSPGTTSPPSVAARCRDRRRIRTGRWSTPAGPSRRRATFVADLAADRPGVLVDGRQSVAIGARTIVLLVRSWPDDPAWRTSVTDLLVRGAPAIGAEVGIDWPMGPTLEVRETIARAGGDGSSAGVEGAGAFDASRRSPRHPLHRGSDGHPARRRARLVQRLDRRRSLGGGGVRGLLRRPRRRHHRGGDPIARDDVRCPRPERPAERLGRRWGRTTCSAMRLPSSWRGMSRRAPATTSCRMSGGTPPPGSARTSPSSPLGEGSLASPEQAVGPVDWRSLLDLLEAHSESNLRCPLASLGRAARRCPAPRCAREGAEAL